MKVLAAILVLASVALAAPTRAAAPDYDVAVYGGTPGGFAAAVAAARNGAKVVLIEQTGHVGGLNTSGINTSEIGHMLLWTVGGIAMEFYERLGKSMGMDGPALLFLSGKAERMFNEMLDEARVEKRFGLRVVKVEKDGPRIRRITLTDGSTVAAAVYVDATYEGDLLHRAGVSSTVGRESREQYGEELAGIRFEKTMQQGSPYAADGRLLPGVSDEAAKLKEGAAHRAPMNYNFRLCFTQVEGNKAPIPPPAHYDPARFELLGRFCAAATAAGRALVLTDFIDLYKREEGKFEVNNKQAAVISIGHFGGQFDYPEADYEKRDAIYADHKEYTLGFLHFLATDERVPETVRAEMRSWGLAKDEFADNGNWPYYLYVREARRMVGPLVMTQKDVQESRRKDDTVGMGSHFIDCHHVQRVAVSATEFCNEGRIWRLGYAYQVPYRALTPREAECDNLLVPVAASFSHVAFCTFRLESTWMVAGHAAGTAAAQAAKQGVAVQRLPVGPLQEALRREKQVIDFEPGEPEKFPGRTKEF